MGVSTPDRVKPRAVAPPRRSPTTGRRAEGPPPFERLIDAHGRAVLRFCVARVGPDRAEDVFQETMLSALRAYEQVRDAQARSWLLSIAARKAIDAHRAEARAPQPVADPEPPPRAADQAARLEPSILEPIRDLPEKQREAVALRVLGELSHREVAEVMHTSEAAARRNVFEALRRLRSVVEHPATPRGATR
jgi:RNA polymerase sigma factor (sigma-70 family)